MKSKYDCNIKIERQFQIRILQMIFQDQLFTLTTGTRHLRRIIGLLLCIIMFSTGCDIYLSSSWLLCSCCAICLICSLRTQSLTRYMAASRQSSRRSLPEYPSVFSAISLRFMALLSCAEQKDKRRDGNYSQYVTHSSLGCFFLVHQSQPEG